MRRRRKPELEYFTKPSASVKRLSLDTNGVAPWPREVRNIAKCIPASLPESVVHGLGCSLDDISRIGECGESNRVLSKTNEESNSGEQLQNAMRLALWLYKQFWEGGRSNICGSWSSSAFRVLLHTIISSFFESCSVQEQVEYAVPRGQSERLNVLLGLSETRQKAPFIALYDAQKYGDTFSSQVQEYLAEFDVPVRGKLSSFSKESFELEREEYSASASTSDVRSSSSRESFDENECDVSAELQDGPSCSSEADTEQTLTFESSSSFDSRHIQITKSNRIPNEIHQDDNPNHRPPNVKDAYLLTEPQITRPPGIAILCAGPMDELETLMLSAIYHRSVWGIREPLIGFSWDSTGMVIRTVFGWMDENMDERGRLPDAHIVYAEDSEDPNNNSGVFDLRDPESVLRLVLFLWNIREDVERITRKVEEAVPDVVRAIKEGGLMQWRADMTPREVNEGCMTREDVFSLWRESMELVEDEDEEVPMWQVETLQRDSEEDSTSDMSSSDGEDYERHLERTRLYFQDDDGHSTTPTDERWIQDRRAFSIRLPGDEELPSSSSSRDIIIKLFKRYTQFYRPPNSSDQSMDATFLADIRRFYETADVHTLEDDVWEHMMPHMGMISFLSASARKKMDYKVKHQLAQSEARAEWETLMGVLFHAGVNSEHHLWTECAQGLNLPRNVVSDLLPSIFDHWKTYATKFLEFSAFLQAQKLELEAHWLKLIDSKCSEEVIEEARLRMRIFAGRVCLFLSDENKRHLWRSLQRDAMKGRESCVGVVGVDASRWDVGSYEFPTVIFPIHDDVPSSTDSDIIRLHIPLLCYGYPGRTITHPHRIPQTSMNHARMNVVAGVTYLASLGVVEFPLFGVATEGSVGTVICAWCGPLGVMKRVQSCIYVLDQDTVKYDLATPLGAYNYAIFLSILAKKHAPELARRLAKVMKSESEASGKGWVENGWMRKDWTMAEQVGWAKEYGYLDEVDWVSA